MVLDTIVERRVYFAQIQLCLSSFKRAAEDKGGSSRGYVQGGTWAVETHARERKRGAQLLQDER